MEKIKQAISKARGQNGDQNKGQIAAVARKSSIAAMQSGDDLDDLAYTQTRVVPMNPQIYERNHISAYDKKSAISPVFDMLRTEVLAKMEENNWRSIAVVSPTPESGKTFVSINLAMSIAHQPHKSVMLVDFDLRRPKIASYMGLSLEHSLNDYLADKIDLADALVNPSIPRLVVLAANKPVNKSSEVLSTKRVETMVTEIRERYDSRVIIYDLPPLLNVDDPRVIIPQVDCVLMVIANGQNTPEEIAHAYSLIPQEKFLGYVFNKAERNNTGYYYY